MTNLSVYIDAAITSISPPETPFEQTGHCKECIVNRYSCLIIHYSSRMTGHRLSFFKRMIHESQLIWYGSVCFSITQTCSMKIIKKKFNNHRLQRTINPGTVKLFTSPPK